MSAPDTAEDNSCTISGNRPTFCRFLRPTTLPPVVARATTRIAHLRHNAHLRLALRHGHLRPQTDRPVRWVIAVLLVTLLRARPVTDHMATARHVRLGIVRSEIVRPVPLVTVRSGTVRRVLLQTANRSEIAHIRRALPVNAPHVLPVTGLR